MKFTQEPIYTAQDILRHTQREDETGCMRTPKKLPFGSLQSNVWHVQIAELSPTGRRRRKAAIWVIHRFYYAGSLIRHAVQTSHTLRRTCKTQGCLNYEHYDIFNQDYKTFGEQYMSREQVINLLTKAKLQDETVTFADASTAESFRMYVYRLKRQWKTHYPELYARFEDVVIKKDKLHPNILDFTNRGRAFDDVLSRFGGTVDITSEAPQERLSPEEQQFLDDAVSGRDHGREVLTDLGYAVTPPTPNEEPIELNAGNMELPNALTYDAVNAKAIAFSLMGGEPLTAQEEAILLAGPDKEKTE